MARPLCGSLLAIAACSALAACASGAPPSVKANAPVAAASPAALKEVSDRQRGYSRVTRNGEDYFCRRKPVTGSLTRTVETCFTQAQLDASAQNAKDFLNRVQGVPGQPAGTGPLSSGVTQPQ
jgi:hypothetical protein